MAFWSSIFHQNKDYNGLKHRKGNVPKNIYEKKITFKKYNEKFHRIHYVFKYKYLVPLLALARKILGKYLITKIPKENHNRNIIIFKKSFNEAIDKWNKYYLRNQGDPSGRMTRRQVMKQARQMRDNGPLATMRDATITMYLYDTAYREFINILMHEIAHGMVKEYTRPEYLKDGKLQNGHLFFTTDVYDTNYYILEKIIQYQVQVSVQEAERLLQPVVNK